jgi:hypothetical protein
MQPSSARRTRLQHGDSGQNSKNFESRGEISRIEISRISENAPSDPEFQHQSSDPISQKALLPHPLVRYPISRNFPLPLNDLPKFSGDGKDDLDSWISLVKGYLKSCPYSMSQQVDIVLFALTGIARDALLSYGDYASVEEIFETLRSTFLPSVNKMHRLVQAKQGKDELVTIFISRLRKYVREIGSMSDESFEEIALYYFLNGLRPEISKRISSDKPKTLDQALAKAKEVEGELGFRRELNNDSLFASNCGTKSGEKETMDQNQVSLLQAILNRLENLPNSTSSLNEV